MITRLAHICINSSDLAATETFYGGVLGLERTFSFIKDGELFGFYLGFGEQTYIEVFRTDAAPSASRDGCIKHICLEVPSIDKVIEALQTAGHSVSEKKLGCDGSWQCWATDPNGVAIEFHEYTETSKQLVGGDCQVDW